MLGEKGTDKTSGDGRSARRERTRRSILGALRALLDDGQLRPTASQIAERAGVSVRSIGQHFGTQEALLQAGSRAFLERLADDSGAPAAGRSLEARVEGLVRERVAFAEETANLRRAIGFLDRPSPAVEQAALRARRRRREELERVFGDELAPLADGERSELLAALEGSVSGALWDELRGGIGLSKTAASRAMSTLVTALLAKAGASGSAGDRRAAAGPRRRAVGVAAREAGDRER